MTQIIVLRVGDKVRVIGRGDVPHFGIVVEDGPRGLRIVHNDKDAGYVHETDYYAFSGDAVVFLESRKARSDRERELIAWRARFLIGSQYDLVNFNCEHAANYAESGQAVSPSVNAVGGLLLFGFLAWLVRD